MINTCCPGLTRPWSRRACSAVEPETGDHRRLFEGEVRRLGRQLVLRSVGALREGALADAEHRIAGPEPGHVAADRLHDPGQFIAGIGGLGRA
jgi:hypothetical protein